MIQSDTKKFSKSSMHLLAARELFKTSNQNNLFFICYLIQGNFSLIRIAQLHHPLLESNPSILIEAALGVLLWILIF